MIKESEVLSLLGKNLSAVDVAGVFLLLSRVWAEGYESGVSDGCDDVLVSDQSPNPYISLAGGGGDSKAG